MSEYVEPKETKITEQETLVEMFTPIIDKIAEMPEVEDTFFGIDGEKERTLNIQITLTPEAAEIPYIRICPEMRKRLCVKGGK